MADLDQPAPVREDIEYGLGLSLPFHSAGGGREGVLAAEGISDIGGIVGAIDELPVALRRRSDNEGDAEEASAVCRATKVEISSEVSMFSIAFKQLSAVVRLLST